QENALTSSAGAFRVTCAARSSFVVRGKTVAAGPAAFHLLSCPLPTHQHTPRSPAIPERGGAVWRQLSSSARLEIPPVPRRFAASPVRFRTPACRGSLSR